MIKKPFPSPDEFRFVDTPRLREAYELLDAYQRFLERELKRAERGGFPDIITVVAGAFHIAEMLDVIKDELFYLFINDKISGEEYLKLLKIFDKGKANEFVVDVAIEVQKAIKEKIKERSQSQLEEVI